MIEHSHYVKKKKGPQCKICKVLLQYGDPYVKMGINRFANPYFHAQCLIDAGVKAQATNLEGILKKYLDDEKTRLEKLGRALLDHDFRGDIKKRKKTND